MEITTELLEKEKEEYDFRSTFVYQVLDSSYRFKEEYPSPSSIWVEPKNFLKIYKGCILDAISSMEGDFWNLIFGYEGSGKSSLSLMIFSTLTNRDLEKILTNTIFLQNEYAKIAYYFSKNQIFKEPILIDDAHYIFGKYNTLTKETLSTIQLTRFFRDQQIIHVVNTQSPTQLYRDIWFERINSYVYTFKLKKILEDGSSIYRMYACVYLENNTGDLKADMENIRNVGNWKYIISHYPPSMITRFDLLFNEYSKEYEVYKRIKQFYKQFYAFLRGKGIVKGDDYETLFRLLYSLVSDNKILISDRNQYKRLMRAGLIDKNANVVCKELVELAENNKEVIEKRMGLLERVMR